jgi:predicted metal-dependent hydrolase
MSKRTPDQVRYWSETNKGIGRHLQKYYQACVTEELPPRLREVLKKLDEEKPELGRVQKTGKTKD